MRVNGKQHISRPLAPAPATPSVFLAKLSEEVSTQILATLDKNKFKSLYDLVIW